MAEYANQLPVPGDAFADADAAEVLRAWIVAGGLHVSLQTAFEDPAVWGILLTDIARHAARAYASETVMSEDQALGAIKDMLDAEWARPTDPGTTQARQ